MIYFVEWVRMSFTLFYNQYLFSVIIYGEALLTLLVTQSIKIYIIKRLRFVFFSVLEIYFVHKFFETSSIILQLL